VVEPDETTIDKTNIADGRLLCPRHHSYAHSPTYEMKTIPNGRVVFSRT
jgi:hypothetical protein